MNLEDTLNVAELAELYGVHRHTIEAWVKDGLPATRDGAPGSTNRAPLRAAVQWVRARDQRIAADALEKAKEAASGEESSKGRKLAAEARLKELAVLEREGRLVPVDEVEVSWMQKTITIREAVMLVAGSLVQSNLVRQSDEIKVEGILRDALVSASAKLDESGA